MESKGPKYSVLVVDDSDDDRFFLRRAIGKDARLTIISELCDGEEAVTYLGGEGKFANRKEFPMPDLMLLDLKMPKKTGHEVLEWMQMKSMSKPVVVVLTSSTLPEDLARSLDLGAAAYHYKSAGREDQALFVRALETLMDKFPVGQP